MVDTNEPAAKDLSAKLSSAVQTIDDLRDVAFCRHGDDADQCKNCPMRGNRNG